MRAQMPSELPLRDQCNDNESKQISKNIVVDVFADDHNASDRRRDDDANLQDSCDTLKDRLGATGPLDVQIEHTPLGNTGKRPDVEDAMRAFRRSRAVRAQQSPQEQAVDSLISKSGPGSLMDDLKNSKHGSSQED